MPEALFVHLRVVQRVILPQDEQFLGLFGKDHPHGFLLARLGGQLRLQAPLLHLALGVQLLLLLHQRRLRLVVLLLLLCQLVHALQHVQPVQAFVLHEAVDVLAETSCLLEQLRTELIVCLPVFSC